MSSLGREVLLVRYRFPAPPLVSAPGLRQLRQLLATADAMVILSRVAIERDETRPGDDFDPPEIQLANCSAPASGDSLLYLGSVDLSPPVARGAGAAAARHGPALACRHVSWGAVGPS